MVNAMVLVLLVPVASHPPLLVRSHALLAQRVDAQDVLPADGNSTKDTSDGAWPQRMSGKEASNGGCAIDAWMGRTANDTAHAAWRKANMPSLPVFWAVMLLAMLGIAFLGEHAAGV